MVWWKVEGRRRCSLPFTVSSVTWNRWREAYTNAAGRGALRGTLGQSRHSFWAGHRWARLTVVPQPQR
jgi:hypothetical protein